MRVSRINFHNIVQFFKRKKKRLLLVIVFMMIVLRVHSLVWPWCNVEPIKQPLWLDRLEESGHTKRPAAILAPFNETLFQYDKKYGQGVRGYRADFKNPCWIGEGGSIECVPYFYVLGFPKSGISLLYNSLVLHPQIVSPPHRDTSYWGTVSTVDREYIPLFENVSKIINKYHYDWGGHPAYHPLVTFDCDPSLVWLSEWLPISLQDSYPKTKLIMTLRHPTDRFFARYYEWFTESSTKPFSTEAFDTHVYTEVHEAEKCLKMKSAQSCMATHSRSDESVYRSVYITYIEAWFKVFPREQMLFIKTDDLFENRPEVMNATYRFLELGPPPIEVNQALESKENRFIRQRAPKPAGKGQGHKINKDARRHLDAGMTSFKRKVYNNEMSPDTREMLDNFYKPFNEQLAELLGDARFLFTRD